MALAAEASAGPQSDPPDPARTVIINVQGDQPFIDPAVIDAMAEAFSAITPAPAVLTPVYRMAAEKVHNPNVVKTLLAADGRALYFSRSAIPHVRGVEPAEWPQHAPYWGHVGIYGYRADVLTRWPGLPASPLEQIEKLEQLRLIEAGIPRGHLPCGRRFPLGGHRRATGAGPGPGPQRAVGLRPACTRSCSRNRPTTIPSFP